MTRSLGILWLVSSASLSLPAVAATDLSAFPIVNFHVVSDGAIYRGARPGTQGLEALAALGVRTDLNLDDDDEAIPAEAATAKRLGIDFVSYSMSGFWKPRNAVVDAALAVLADPASYPVYVHCRHGEDRTGLIVGLHRVFADHWAPASAYQEMREFGFHPELLLLRHYFDERSGLDFF